MPRGEICELTVARGGEDIKGAFELGINTKLETLELNDEVKRMLSQQRQTTSEGQLIGTSSEELQEVQESSDKSSSESKKSSSSSSSDKE